MRNGEGWLKDAQTSDQGPISTTSGDGTDTSSTAAANADSPPAVDANITATDHGNTNVGQGSTAAAYADSPPAVDANITATDLGNINVGQGELMHDDNTSSPIISQRVIPGAYHCYPNGRVGHDDLEASGSNGNDEFNENESNIPATTTRDIEVEAVEVPDNDEQEETIDRLNHELGSARRELDVARTQLSAPVIEGVPLSDSTEENKGGENKRVRVIASLLLLCTIAVVVGVSVHLTQQSSDGQDDPPQVKEVLPPVLDNLKERGVLRCGVNPDSPSGFVNTNNVTGEKEGFEIDFCKAVAAASMGSSSYSIKTTVVMPATRFLMLESGEIDLLVASTTHTFDRDVHESSTGVGFSFSAPYLYGGLTFNGVPEFVSCADELNAVGDCAGLKICVSPGTTWMDVVSALFPGSNIVSIQENSDSLQGLIDGICNVVVGEQYEAPEGIVRQFGYEGPYAMGKNSFSKEPLAMVTRDGDPEFADYVNQVLLGLFQGEEQNVTSLTADTFPKISLFGDEHEDMLQNALSAVGNYGEIYSRHLEHIAPRLNINMLNKGDTGLLYSHPFGKVDTIGPGPTKGGVIERIIQRGFLRCGITLEDSQEAETIPGTMRAGLDIEFCRALSAIMFQGMTENISFKSFSEVNQNISLALETGDIDVYAGGGMHMSGDVPHPGLSFSTPYFFEAEANYSTAFKAHLLATKDDDTQWRDLLHWIIMASIFAEENGIVQKTSNEMPLVNLFGPNLERVLRDAILAVGNYGEMHMRVFGQNVTRVGRNLLNVPPFDPQHNPLRFGNHLVD